MSDLKKRRIEKKKNNFSITLITVLAIIIGIGFAIISNTFGFLGTANIAKGGIWDVRFENLSVTDGSVFSSTPAYISNGEATTINFNIRLEKQEDFYEFGVDLVNKGTIDGKISQVKLEGTPSEFMKYLDYTVTYNDDKLINVNDLLLNGESKRIKVRIKYVDDVDMSDFESDEETLSLSFEIKVIEYIKSGSTINSGKNLIQVLGLEDKADLDSNVDFGSVPNKSGLYLKSDTESSEYPIYYYRGEVSNNNVLFAGYCWKIVRTTENGGTKLIYSGTSDGSTCTEEDSIGLSTYNSVRKGAIYTGYMYNEESDIQDIDDAVNLTNSDIKYLIDDWYLNNLSSYESMLADEIFCNDRATISTSTTVNFAAKTDRGLDGDTPSPSLSSCTRNIDRFTESSTNGNGNLSYKVGLLTADEAVYAGLNANEGSSYLGENGFWTMTPTSATSSAARVFVVEGIVLSYTNVTDEYGVRPVIVLRAGVNVSGGNGSTVSPYVIPEMSFEDKKELSIIQQLTLDESAKSDSGVNFGNIPLNDALYVVSGTEENDYPIYYYRGNVTSNNVLFANFCWKIVRTTELGGTKLVYNGEPDGGKCDAVGEGTVIETGSYNSLKKGPIYTGYMFNEESNIKDTDDVVNTLDSDIKSFMDNWYLINLNTYTDMLEDEVWCNDRSTESTTATVNFSSITERLLDDETPAPKLSCTRNIDKFTKESLGNRKLIYKIGLLTADEVVMSGYNANDGSSYLGSANFWTMTPASANASNARIFIVEDGYLSYTNVTEEYGIRPSIVLKAGTKVSSGTGSVDNPYVIE